MLPSLGCAFHQEVTIHCTQGEFNRPSSSKEFRELSKAFLLFRLLSGLVIAHRRISDNAVKDLLRGNRVERVLGYDIHKVSKRQQAPDFGGCVVLGKIPERRR